MQYHEAANIFPIDEENIQSLADDIAKNGLLQPIEIFEGKILDGRRRSAACLLAGVDPDYSEVNPADPVAYVLSLNLHRRHLTPSQLSMVGARAREIYDRQAKERQKLSQGRGVKGVENLPHLNSDTGRARDAVGKAVGVSGKSIDYATKVLNEAPSAIVNAVDAGNISVSKAAKLVRDSKSTTESKAKAFNRDAAGDRLCDWLRAELNKWPEKHRHVAAHWIRQILEKEFNL